MKKGARWVLGAVASASLMAAISFTAIANDIKVTFNGEYVSVSPAPVIVDGRTLIPASAITDILGATVTYDDEANQIAVELGGTSILLTIDSNIAVINGEQTAVPTPARIINGNMFIPLRLVMENLGVGVDFQDGVVAMTAEGEDQRYMSEVDVLDLWANLENEIYEQLDGYSISFHDTKIYIDDANITVNTVLVAHEDSTIVSADYVFLVETDNGDVHYRLISSDVHEDTRNMNVLITTLDGIDFFAPWLTVSYGGQTEYYVYNIPDYTAYLTWAPPYPNLKQGYRPWTYNFDNDDRIGMDHCFIHNGIAYITFVYKYITDVYVWDIKNGSGYWMSGAEDLGVFYEAELEIIHDLREQDIRYSEYFFRNYDVVGISPVHDYALMRRSLGIGGPEGKYLMRNLTTGEETFIADSFTSDYIFSAFEESYRWLADGNLLLQIISNTEKKGIYWIFYKVVFGEEGWIVSETEQWNLTEE